MRRNLCTRGPTSAQRAPSCQTGHFAPSSHFRTCRNMQHPSGEGPELLEGRVTPDVVQLVDEQPHTVALSEGEERTVLRLLEALHGAKKLDVISEDSEELPLGTSQYLEPEELPEAYSAQVYSDEPDDSSATK